MTSLFNFERRVIGELPITFTLVGSPGVGTVKIAGELSSKEFAIIFICSTSEMHLTN
jgi:hypothetical protein